MTDTGATRTSDPLALLLAADDLQDYRRSLAGAALVLAPSADRAALVVERPGRPPVSAVANRAQDSDAIGAPRRPAPGPVLTAPFVGGATPRTADTDPVSAAAARLRRPGGRPPPRGASARHGCPGAATVRRPAARP